MNKNKKGFTLMEILVVVLIIGILATIALPSYKFAVEKSRAAQGIASLTQIARAQKIYNEKKGTYAEDMLSLPLDMQDDEGNNIMESVFSDRHFDYKIFGDDEHATVARRNNGEYELSIDYGTGEVFCSPIEHKICQDFDLREGQVFYPPQWETCAGQIDNLWRGNFSANDYKEGRVNYCQVRINPKNNTTEFEMCFNKAHEIIGVYGTWSLDLRQPCIRGTFSGDGNLIYCQYASSDDRACVWLNSYEKIDDDKILSLSCNSPNYIDSEKFVCTGVSSRMIRSGDNYRTELATARCYHNSEGECPRWDCVSGDCSLFEGII